MESLRHALESTCRGRTAFVGVGNTDRGDDGAGMALASALREAGVADVFDGGALPERVLPQVRQGGFDSVVFLDAVDCSAEPGSVTVLPGSEVEARFPMVSTHKLSLGLLAGMLQGPSCSVWLVGVQPQSIALNPGLSAPVTNTVHMLARELAAMATRACEEHVCN
jgi:hydrogenase maturation protease